MSSKRKTRLKSRTFSYKERGRLSQRKDLDVVYVTHKKTDGKKGSLSGSRPVLIVPTTFYNRRHQHLVVHRKEQNLIFKNWEGFQKAWTESLREILQNLSDGKQKYVHPTREKQTAH